MQKRNASHDSGCQLHSYSEHKQNCRLQTVSVVDETKSLATDYFNSQYDTKLYQANMKEQGLRPDRYIKTDVKEIHCDNADLWYTGYLYACV
jgi:hypothetical protein